MSDRDFRIRTILALIDFSGQTPKVEALATSLASRYGARLCFLHVEPPEPDFVGYRPGPPAVRQELAAQWRREHAQIQELGRRAKEAGLEVLALQVQGPKVDSIVDEAIRLHADMVIAAFHPHGVFYRLTSGDTFRELATRLPCPLMLVTESAAGGN